MDYLKNIIKDAHESNKVNFDENMNELFEKYSHDGKTDSRKVLLGAVLFSQKQNLGIFYDVLNKLHSDGYLNLPEDD